MLQFLGQPWFGSAIGMVGLIAAFLFYRWARGVTELAFQHESNFVFDGPRAVLPSEIEVYYRGAAPSTVIASRYVFWNSGNTTLEGNQIVASDPFRLEMRHECRVLKAQLLRVSRKVNRVSCSPLEDHLIQEQSAVTIAFDFLDPGDGFVIEVFHTGGKSSIAAKGTFRRMPKGPTNLGETADQFKRRWKSQDVPAIPPAAFVWSFGAAAVFLCVIAPISLAMIQEPNGEYAANTHAFSIILFCCGILSGSVSLDINKRARRRYPRVLGGA